LGSPNQISTDASGDNSAASHFDDWGRHEAIAKRKVVLTRPLLYGVPFGREICDSFQADAQCLPLLSHVLLQCFDTVGGALDVNCELFRKTSADRSEVITIVRIVFLYSFGFQAQVSSGGSTGWPKKVSHSLPSDQKIVLKPVNEIRFIRQIKV